MTHLGRVNSCEVAFAEKWCRSWKSTDRSENGLAGSDNWISGVWFNPYPVVHCSAEPLLAAKIFFSSLYGRMS